MTKVIGIISWFDESPTWLASTVASMARICDHIIAVDGRYALYDDSRVCSEMVQHDAIQHTARAAGCALTLHIPNAPFDDEMHKRTYLFQLAELVAKPFEDWIFAIDGDEVLIEAPPKERLHKVLDDAAAEDCWVVTGTLRDVADPHKNPERTLASMKMPIVSAIECTMPRFFRVGKNMRVVGYHYNYVAEDETGNSIEYWGDDNLVDRAKWKVTSQFAIIEHRHEQRALTRKRVREQYYKDRKDVGLETREPLGRLERKAMI
jgi:hypothetical protein